ncbi:glycosyl hydrolase family 18 protein [Fontibacillus sp. BL9]|uniref:glycosyl hydrolase family 18 protein n=1 Tax=Fontibacillus sp. BL9 TaxID=3389971 RepID=UPI00397DD968
MTPLVPRQRSKWIVWFLLFVITFSPLLSPAVTYAEEGSATPPVITPADNPATATSSTYENVTASQAQDPLAPQNLRLTTVTHNSATFEWDFVEGDNDIQVWDADTNGWKAWGNLWTRSVTGLSPETTYRIYITWNSDSKKEHKSNVLEFTTLADTSQYKDAPLAPPSYLKVSDLTADSVTLAWGSSPGATGYDIYVDEVWKGGTWENTATTATYSTLEPGKVYKFEVGAQKSVDGVVEASANSNALILKWGELAQPQGLQIVTATRSTVALGWAPVPGATSYEIYQDGVSIGSSAESRHVATGLDEGTTYEYTVVAKNRLWTSPASEPVTAVPGANYNNITYYSSWSESASGRNFKPSDIDVSQVTHINYAFADLCWKKFGSTVRACEDPDIPSQNRYVYDGEIIIGDPQADFRNFASFETVKAAHPHLKLMVSVGGWSWSNNFSNAAKTEENRRTFANSAVQFLREYHFDGLDVDWEYPVEGGEDDNSRGPEDTENFTLLMKTVREALDAAGSEDGKYYLLTIASGQGDNFVKNANLADSVQYLDFINIMTYDYSGNWEMLAYHNSPLFFDHKHPRATSSAPRNNVLGGLLGHLNGGVPTHKLVAGVPLYGKGWAGCSVNGQYDTCTDVMPGTWEPNILDYTDIESNFVNKNGYIRYWNEAAKVAYLYNKEKQHFITYNDKTTMMYTASMVKSLDIAGVMSWDISGDRNRTLTTQLIHDLPIDGSVNASALAAPSGLTSISKTADSIRIEWTTAPDADEYEIYVNNAMVGTTTTAKYTIASLVPGTTYNIHVLAIAKSGDEISQVSPASQVISVQTSTGSGSGGNSGGSGSSGGSGGSSGSGSNAPKPQQPKPDDQLDVKVVLEGDKAVLTLPVNTAVGTINGSNASNFQISAGDEAKQAEIELPQEVIAALSAKEDQASLSILVGGKEYRIPAALLSGAGNVKISILTPSEADAAAVSPWLRGKTVLAAPTVFSIHSLKGSQKPVELKQFGKSTVSEFITLAGNGVDVESLTGVVYVPGRNEIRPVPTRAKANSDGTITVEIKKTGSGIYALLQSKSPAFSDVPYAWAQKDVSQAVAKLITAGNSETNFGGKQNATRGEIVSMIVRGLGIIPDSGNPSVFSDVDPQSVFAADIAAAYAVGLVKGRNNGTFDPDGLVTRQELAVILASAMEYAGQKNEAAGSTLDPFKDKGKVSPFAQEAMARMVSHHIILGLSVDELAPQAHVTREQIVVTVMRTLRALNMAD